MNKRRAMSNNDKVVISPADLNIRAGSDVTMMSKDAK
jgi:hypothetical protein